MTHRLDQAEPPPAGGSNPGRDTQGEAGILAEAKDLRSLLTLTQERMRGDLRAYLDERLDKNFHLLGEQLDKLESSLRAAAPIPLGKIPGPPAGLPPAGLPLIAPPEGVGGGSPETEADPAAIAAPDAAARRIAGLPAAPAPDGEAQEANGGAIPWLESELPAKPKPGGGMTELQFGQKWLLIAGVAIMVLGVGYFLKYAFDQEWIGPAGRVALAYAAGIACLGAGEAFRRAAMFRGFGFALMGGGIAILYFSGFAAHQLYGLIGQSAAFGLLALITALAGTLAYVHHAQWLAILGLIGGFATPVVLSSGADSQIALMTYMTALNLAVLGLARARAWRLLTTLAFLFTWLLFAGWFHRHYSDEKFWPTTLFLNVFHLIHFLAPVAYYLRRESRIPVFGFGTAMPNAFIAFGFSHYTISRHASVEYVGIATLAYALMAIALASRLRRQSAEADRRPFILLLVLGLLFLVITIPVVLSRHWITVFWAAQAGALMWAARRLDAPPRTDRPKDGRRLAAGAMVLLATALIKLFLYDYPVIFGFGVNLRYHAGFSTLLADRWLAIGMALAALAATARWLPAAWRWLRIYLGGLLASLLFIALTIETAAFFSDYAPAARFAAISVLWGLYAAACLIFGFARNLSLSRKAGIGLFGVTAVKIFLVDMARVSTPFRIISFVALGVFLIGASFLYYRYRDRLPGAAKDTPPEPQEPDARREEETP